VPGRHHGTHAVRVLAGTEEGFVLSQLDHQYCPHHLLHPTDLTDLTVPSDQSVPTANAARPAYVRTTDGSAR
jgi:hypothetical protein